MYNHLTTTILLALVSTASYASAQSQRSSAERSQGGIFDLPILSDPVFQLLSGEVIASQQLGSWDIKLGPISVDLSLDLSSLGLKLKRDERRSRSFSVLPSSGSSSRFIQLGSSAISISSTGDSEAEYQVIAKRLLGLDLGLLNLGLGFGKSNPREQGEKEKEKALINLDLGLDLSSLFGWGNADDVARGERGDTEWYTYITVGSPPQSIPVLPDTGSADLFVFGPSCTSCHLNNHVSFDPTSSISYTNLSQPWNYLYADGSGALGYTSIDKVAFGGMAGVQMQFVIATEVGGADFKESRRSGVMGLGLDLMSTLPQAEEGMTLFSKLVKAQALYENMLSIRLVKGTQSQGVVAREGDGRYTLGGIEEADVRGGRGSMIWADVISSNYWGFTMDDMLVGSKSILAQDKQTPRRAIIDTGTTLIITSDTASSAIHAQIRGADIDRATSIWYIPCTTSYPETGNVFFSIGGRKHGVPISDLAWKKSDVFDGMCISGVQGGMDAFTVLGDMFIKNHYVVLSYGKNRGDRPQVGLGDRTDVLPIL